MPSIDMHVTESVVTAVDILRREGLIVMITPLDADPCRLYDPAVEAPWEWVAKYRPMPQNWWLESRPIPNALEWMLVKGYITDATPSDLKVVASDRDGTTQLTYLPNQAAPTQLETILAHLAHKRRRP